MVGVVSCTRDSLLRKFRDKLLLRVVPEFFIVFLVFFPEIRKLSTTYVPTIHKLGLVLLPREAKLACFRVCSVIVDSSVFLGSG